MIGLVRRMMSIVNRVLAVVDPLFSADGPAQPDPLFIVGAPRSGTTLVYQIVTQQFRCAYFTRQFNYAYGAPNLLARMLRPFCRRPAAVFESNYGSIAGWRAPAEIGNFWFRWLPQDGVDGHYVEPREGALDDYGRMRDTVGSLARIFGAPLVFKSVYLSMAIGVLAAIFPDARFVFVRRDPFFTSQSILVGRLKRRDPDAWWSVKIPGYRDLAGQPLWYQATEQVCATERIVERDLARHADGRHFVINYEELCARPRDIVERLAAWLPEGFERYADPALPDAFPVSRRITVSEETADRIRTQLRERNRWTAT
ncbi:MAG TPA: sulfotransferase [Acidiferrobacterales bacterium]